jgi:hypothetical protein
LKICLPGIKRDEQGGRMSFKEGAIYQLPNGRELVVLVTQGDGVILCNLSASVPGQYELTPEGRLLFLGKLTAWEMKDLHETGRVASPDLTAHLAGIPLSDPDGPQPST